MQFYLQTFPNSALGSRAIKSVSRTVGTVAGLPNRSSRKISSGGDFILKIPATREII